MEEQMKQIAQQVYNQNQAKNQNTTFVVPKHVHNGVDTNRIDIKDIARFPANPTNGQTVVFNSTTNQWEATTPSSSSSQYSQTADYTSNQTVTIACGFTPKEVHFNGYFYNSSGNIIYGTTTGFAGVISPQTGMNNYYSIQAVTLAIDIGTGLHLGGNSTCYCYVSSWTSTGIVLTVICPTNWHLSTNLMITG